MHLAAPVLAVIPPAPAPPPPPPPPRTAFSAEQERELDALHELLRCPGRRRILFGPTAGGSTGSPRAGRANVGELERRTHVPAKTLSHHLGHLRTAGLVFGQRRGKHIEYEPAPGRVRYQRHADDGRKFSLTR